MNNVVETRSTHKSPELRLVIDKTAKKQPIIIDGLSDDSFLKADRSFSEQRLENLKSSSFESGSAFLVSSPEARILAYDNSVPYAMSRGDSAHDVTFGGLRVVNPGSNQPEMIRVAVKTYEGSPEKAAVEMLNTIYVKERGFSTFEPVSVFISDQTAYFLTVVNEEITPLDDFNWQDAENRTGLEETLKRCATLLAQFHTEGVFHGDAQIKNFVIDESGHTSAIDWESATILTDEIEQIPPDVFLSKSLHDLRSLYLSLYRTGETAGVNFFAGMGRSQREGTFKQLVLEPYIGYLQDIYLDDVEDARYMYVAQFLEGLDAVLPPLFQEEPILHAN